MFVYYHQSKPEFARFSLELARHRYEFIILSTSWCSREIVFVFSFRFHFGAQFPCRFRINNKITTTNQTTIVRLTTSRRRISCHITVDEFSNLNPHFLGTLDYDKRQREEQSSCGSNWIYARLTSLLTAAREDAAYDRLARLVIRVCKCIGYSFVWIMGYVTIVYSCKLARISIYLYYVETRLVLFSYVLI